MSITLTSADLDRLRVAASTILAPDGEFPGADWQVAVCEVLERIVDGNSFSLGTEYGSEVSAVCRGRPQSLVEESGQLGESSLNVAMDRPGSQGEVVTRERIVAGELAGYRAGPGVHESFLPGQVRDIVGLHPQWPDRETQTQQRLTPLVHNDRHPALRVGQTGAMLVGLLLPVFRAAVVTRERFRAQRAAQRAELAALLDVIPGGAIVVDLEGRVLHESVGLARLLATDADREMVRRAAARMAHVLALRVKSQRTADRGRDSNVAATVASTEVQTSADHYELHGSYVRVLGGDPAVVVTLDSCRRRRFDGAHLRTRHGLTAREINVTHQLVRGRCTAAIARELGLSVHTVRRHTERILAKLAVHSRGAIAERIGMR